jgi:hypothetical protein
MGLASRSTPVITVLRGRKPVGRELPFRRTSARIIHGLRSVVAGHTLLAQAKDSLWSVDFFRCESLILRTHWVMVVMDQTTRRIVGLAVQAGALDGPATCSMFNKILSQSGALPQSLSSDHDPLFRFHRWKAKDLERKLTVRPDQEIHGLSLLMLCAIEMVLLASNADVGLACPPRRANSARVAMPPLLGLGRVRHFNAPLGHHGFEISIAQSVGDLPANAEFDDFSIKDTAAVYGITGGRSSHIGLLGRVRILTGCPRMNQNPTEWLRVMPLRLRPHGLVH